MAPLTDEERKTYDALDFDMEAYKTDIGVAGVTDALLHPTKEGNLMGRWRYPTLSLHGIEGAFDGSGSKTVIPRKVILALLEYNHICTRPDQIRSHLSTSSRGKVVGKFSIRAIGRGKYHIPSD